MARFELPVTAPQPSARPVSAPPPIPSSVTPAGAPPLVNKGAAAANPQLTLMALMARAKDAQARAQGASQMPMGTIPQGLAAMAHAAVAGWDKHRAETAEAEGRAKLAEIVGGLSSGTGPTQEQIGQVMAIDPDLGTAFISDAIKSRRELAAAEAAKANEAAIDERELAQDIAKEGRTAAREREKIETTPLTEVAKIEQDYKLGRYGVQGTPEAMALRDAAMKKATTTGMGGTASDRKALWGQQDEFVETASAANRLRRAGDLLKQGIDIGPMSGVRTWYGKAGGPGSDPDLAARTDEYNKIMTGEAIASMSKALSGATTNEEMARFISLVNDPATPANVKEIEINNMLMKVDAYQRLQEGRITELGGDIPRIEPYAPSVDLPAGITEDDIQTTMRNRGMTRQQVLDAYAAKTGKKTEQK